MVWSLALSPDDAKQGPVAHATEFGVVSLAKAHILHPYSRGANASIFTFRYLSESAKFGRS